MYFLMVFKLCEKWNFIPTIRRTSITSSWWSSTKKVRATQNLSENVKKIVLFFGSCDFNFNCVAIFSEMRQTISKSNQTTRRTPRKTSRWSSTWNVENEINTSNHRNFSVDIPIVFIYFCFCKKKFKFNHQEDLETSPRWSSTRNVKIQI